MMRIWIRFLLLFHLGGLVVHCAHIQGIIKIIKMSSLKINTSGSWNPSEQKVVVVTKFGYQQTKAKNEKDSRGFLYGNFLPQATYNYSSKELCIY